jgi:hypothetical protein
MMLFFSSSIGLPHPGSRPDTGLRPQIGLLPLSGKHRDWKSVGVQARECAPGFLHEQPVDRPVGLHLHSIGLSPIF